MAINIDSVEFNNGVATTPFYQANTGDRISATMRVRGRIRNSSVNNTMSLDPTTNVVTSPAVSWLEEGFRVGDWCYLRQLTSGGSVLNDWWAQVVSVDDLECDFSTMVSFYNLSNSEILDIVVVTGNGSTTAVARDEVDILFNHVKNSTAGTPNSLIDGELTRIRFSGLSALTIGGTINGVILGNKSGSMFLSGLVERLTPIDNDFYYEFTLNFINTGMFDDGTWFFTGECLKAYFQTEWGRVANEPFARKVETYNLAADTGYYNEPFNTGVVDSTLVQGVTNDVEYCVTTSHRVIVDGSLTGVQIGACYLPTDDTYFKNQYESQIELSMVLPSTDVIVGSYNSGINPDGASFEIIVNSVQVAGSQTEIEFDFVPNAAFDTFMDNRDPQDRNFLIWVKCGSINHLVFTGQLECTPQPAGPLVMSSSAAYLDHSQNVLSSSSFNDERFNTEDDFAYYGTFLLNKNETYENFNVYLEAVNNVTGEDFSLRAIQFNFAGVQVSGDGRYLLNEVISVNANLPTTSVKVDALFQLEPSLDTPTEYGVSIYAPFILNWRYWLPLTNASTDFYPNQNQNWQQYSAAADWSTQLRLELVQDGLGFNHTETIEILDYDSEPLIAQTIELEIDATSQSVNIIPIGTLMRVITTHKLLNGNNWDQNDIWGMITIEPTEDQPRYIASSVVPYDYNTNNPLYPLSGTLVDITFPSPNLARMECYFNPDLINLSNGVKFTTKIKGCDDTGIQAKTTTDGIIKTTTTNDDKTLAL